MHLLYVKGEGEEGGWLWSYTSIQPGEQAGPDTLQESLHSYALVLPHLVQWVILYVRVCFLRAVIVVWLADLRL